MHLGTSKKLILPKRYCKRWIVGSESSSETSYPESAYPQINQALEEALSLSGGVATD